MHTIIYIYLSNLIDDVMGSMLNSRVVDRGFETRWVQTKDSKIGIDSFSVQHAVFRGKRTDWFAANQDHVSKWSVLA